jgi:L-seryl-tRNA(Ser) seleniumtransferase
MADQAILAQIPSVDAVLSHPRIRPWKHRIQHDILVNRIRHILDIVRARTVKSDGKRALPDQDAIITQVETELQHLTTPSLRKVINATGIILHTGLGRAPWSHQARQAVSEVMAGYSNLEIDLATGARGERLDHVEELMCLLCHAPAAAVVNNNAAAVLLVLNTLANKKDVIVSHGQLIEIGGSFRLPDIIKRSGARLVAVGTTNRTRIDDYRNAITNRTAVLMMAHTSNYRIQGFTQEASPKELVELGKETGIPVAYDLGGGILRDWQEWGLPPEPVASDSLRQGISVVTFSGDKVLGGPQAGLIVGDKSIIRRLRKNPLMRALRCDKITLAALEATLRLYLSPDQFQKHVTAWKLLTEPVQQARKRAQTLAKQLRELDGSDAITIEIRDTEAEAGSGTLPLEKLPSVAVVLTPNKGSAQKLAGRFRQCQVPVIGYLKDQQFVLDLKAIAMNDIAILTQQAASVFANFP